MEWLVVIKTLAPWFVAGGAAYGGAKQALNGTRQRVKRLEEAEQQQDKKLGSLSEGLVRIETKQDMMIELMKTAD